MCEVQGTSGNSISRTDTHPGLHSKFVEAAQGYLPVRQGRIGICHFCKLPKGTYTPISTDWETEALSYFLDIL